MSEIEKQKYVTNVKKILVSLMGTIISYFGAALGALVNIGQGPVTAFCLTGSYVTGIQMGTVMMLFQGIFIIGQFLVLKRKFKWVQLLQILMIIFGGGVLNFFLYEVFAHVNISYYWVRVLLGIFSFAINATGVIMVLEADFINIPIEGFLRLLAETKKKKLGRFKKCFDIAMIVITVTICFIAGFPNTIREGTVINAIIFGTVLDLMKDPIDRIYRRYKIA